MSKKYLFLAVLCVSLCQTAHCAVPDKVILDIRQVLELVKENNKNVNAARRNIEAVQQGEKVAESKKLPDVSASLTVNYLGNLTLLNRDFGNAVGYSLPHLGNSLELSVYQPVYAGGAITAGVKLAQTETQLSQNNLEQVRQNVSMEAIGCYLELFKAQNLVSVYDENISMTERILEQMRIKNAEGVVLKNDITRYELRLSTLNYDRLTLSNRIAVLNHDLCVLLGLAEDAEIETSLNEEIYDLPAIETEQQWYESTLQNSLVLKSFDIRRSLNEHQRKLINAERLPHVGLIAGNTFAGPITFEIPAINKNYNVWLVGVNLSYDISSIYKTPKSLSRNRYEYETIISEKDAAQENLNRTIDNVYTQYTQAFTMLETEKKNVELASENYRIVENRFNNQLALLTDMLDASTAKLDADVRLVNARVNIIYYYYQLKYNSGTLL